MKKQGATGAVMLLIQPGLQTPFESKPAAVLVKLADPSGSAKDRQKSSLQFKKKKNMQSIEKEEEKKRRKDNKSIDK